MMDNLMDNYLLRDGNWIIGKAYNPAHDKETLMLIHTCDVHPWRSKNYSDYFLDTACYYCGSKPPDGLQAMLRFLWWDTPS